MSLSRYRYINISHIVSQCLKISCNNANIHYIYLLFKSLSSSIMVDFQNQKLSKEYLLDKKKPKNI